MFIKTISLLSALFLFYNNIIHAQNESLTIDLDKDGVMDKVWIEDSKNQEYGTEYNIKYSLSTQNGSTYSSKNLLGDKPWLKTTENNDLVVFFHTGDETDIFDFIYVFSINIELKKIEMTNYYYVRTWRTEYPEDDNWDDILFNSTYLHFDLRNNEYQLMKWHSNGFYEKFDPFSNKYYESGIGLMGFWQNHQDDIQNLTIQKEKYNFGKKIYLTTFDDNVQIELEEILELL